MFYPTPDLLKYLPNLFATLRGHLMFALSAQSERDRWKQVEITGAHLME